MTIRSLTAEDVAGTPEYYNYAYRIGRRGKHTWECTGLNRDQTKVRFARLTSELHQITVYIAPNAVVYPDGGIDDSDFGEE